MATFITIGYGDQAGYDRTPASGRNLAHAHDDDLRAAGTQMGIAGSPIQVRNPDGEGVNLEVGPFLTSGLPVAGFAVIEADSMEDAVAVVAATPCAVAHGVVEVWPLLDSAS